MSMIHTTGIIPTAVADSLVWLAYLFIAMAMAGLGLHVQLSHFLRLGARPLIASLIGSLLLALLGYGLVVWLGIGG